MTTTESGIGSGTVLITGPTRGLGRSAVLAMAGRPPAERPDLLLVGRAGADLTRVADEARALGARVHEIGCDLARLTDVRAAATAARDLLDAGAVRPLRALVANAGIMSTDIRTPSADGHELTFAVNHLAHALLIGELLDSLTAPARIVLLGSNVYSANVWRKLMGVPEARWRDPLEVARPATGGKNPGFTASGVAYADSKLAILYYAHELQRRAAPGVHVLVFEPGWMPGSGLGRGAPAAFQAMGRGLARLPGVSTPERSGPALASVVLDDRWAGLRDGAFVVKTKVTEVRPVAHDRDREGRLWAATEQLLEGVRSRG
ncbi:NAD(P)-dependent dehydrogenase (short-subunit alcohol dehydrogenase family) [Streptomyces sp. B3I7]|uniref:SDR family NAD(P)-dependent oxidoreductase n=1 Tax=unclassified Streptomyces TaxID=2593676 RepID=UPI0027894864|nr:MULTISPECIES: SDR family NAD(P)-dependent oxidoreductase [unclassified Streptomyces]MDQ0788145.1 NAD(P)-dependent dehydrogenase (short-subunit alcohol dehydrogenase family) [Streptomyces sp. B3I8]MDQ0812266.1 NAD(P)-dependent dehydrogenase (short-subunit alcohol dehydrogenase family) [Streptomyces sp. B3I7]